MKILTDFHHSSLLRATNLLFGERLGFDVYRPIGMEWFEQGYWAINDQEDTARQFLDHNSQPTDNTPPLNACKLNKIVPGVWFVEDPGKTSYHMACTLEYFQNTTFDIIIASIPQHVAIFEKLIGQYQPHAKLIVQMGNDWSFEPLRGKNVLASVKPRPTPDVNTFFYHQEFDTKIFHQSPAGPSKKIYSFINILKNMPMGWKDFTTLEQMLSEKDFDFRSFGGQCRDGNIDGPKALADKMREAMCVFHVKDGGDGFGHIIYNAYSIGRPIITRRRFYAGKLAEELMRPGTLIDLDEHDHFEASIMIGSLSRHPEILRTMGENAAEVFRSVVDYDQEAKAAKRWLERLL